MGEGGIERGGMGGWHWGEGSGGRGEGGGGRGGGGEMELGGGMEGEDWRRGGRHGGGGVHAAIKKVGAGSWINIDGSHKEQVNAGIGVHRKCPFF